MRLAAVAAAVAAVALANYIARKPRDPPVDEQTSDGNHGTSQQSDRHDQVRQSGLGELQDPVVELVPTPPKSAAESPASPNTRRRQQTDVLRPPSRHSSPASMQSSPLTPSNDRTPELGNLCADTDETVVKARPAACRAAPKAGVLPPEPLPEEDVRQRIENDDEVTVGLDCDGEAAGTVEIVVKARPAACRAAPRAGVLTPEPLPEEFFPTHLKTREDLEVLGNDSTGRVEWPKRHQQIEIDDVLLALPANRQCQVQGVPVKVGPNAPSGEFLGSESPSCPHFPLGSHDRNEDVESIVCSGTDDVADNARLSSDPEQIWDDAFFSTLYKKDAEITPRPSPPADTLSTSFYSPATSKPSTKFSSQKLRKGSLGVRIKDVVKNDASCVQVGAILMGGLIWRQGQIESGDLLLKLNGTVIRDCDHLNELMEAVSCTTEDIYMTYQRPPAFALFASRASEQTVVLYKAPKVSPSKESSRWESPPSSEGASLTKSGSDELLPGTTMRSLFPISPTPTIRDTASALKSLQGQHQVTHHTSPAGALVPEMMVFHDSELHSLLDDGNYKDVKGNLLVDTDGLHCADWYHQYMLSDGTCIDLDQRDAVHWYVQAGHEWVPFPVDQSDLLESACRDGYDSVEFSEDILLLLPERKQVHVSTNARQNLLRATWHYQTSNGDFAPFSETDSSRLQSTFAVPSRPSTAKDRSLSATQKYGLPKEEALDMGKGRVIQRLESGIIAQRRNNAVILRLVVDGRPTRDILSRDVSAFSLFSESATPRRDHVELESRKQTVIQGDVPTSIHVREIISPTACRPPMTPRPDK